MALIRCKLCDNKISSRALNCPKCGCPNIARTGDVPKKIKNCAECENGSVDGGFACNLCDVTAPDGVNSVFTVASKQPNQAGIGTPQQTATDEKVDVVLVASIEELEVDDHVKNLFMKFALATSVSRTFGIPQFEYRDDSLRHFRGLNSTGTVDSNLALILGPLFYFAAGIWKKGVLLLLLVLGFCLGVVLTVPLAGAVFGLLIMIVYLVCYCSAKYDRYRHLVLGENFFW